MRNSTDSNIDASDTEDLEDADENGEEVREDDVRSTQGSTPNSSIHKRREAWQVEAPDLPDCYLAAKEARDSEREEEHQQCREEERDEILSFLNALAAALRRLPPQKQSFVKLQIQKLEHKAEFCPAFFPPPAPFPQTEHAGTSFLQELGYSVRHT